MTEQPNQSPEPLRLQSTPRVGGGSAFYVDMPSSRAILLGLLRFGALSATDKLRVLDEYQAHCSSVGGGPHVDEPAWEVMWSLRTHTKQSDDITDAGSRKILSSVHRLSARFLEDEALSSAWDDRTVFTLPISLELESACKEAVECVASVNVEDLPFWDLMCYTCD